MRIERPIAWVIAALFALLPLYPSFIILTGVTPPGVALLSKPASVALFAISAAGALFLGWTLLRPPREVPPTVLPLLVWLGASLLAAALGFNPAAGAIFLLIFGLGLLWHMAIVRYYEPANAAEPIFWSITVSCAVACAAAVAMSLLRLPPALYAIGHGRAIGSFVLPGELAGYLIVMLPLLFALGRVARSRSLRTAAWISLCAGIAAFILTFSRAGWVGLAAAIAFYAAWSGGVRRRYAPLIVLAGVCAVVALFNVHHNPAENYTRLSIWQAGLEMARRFPLTGVGPFDFARIYPLVRLPGGDPQAFHAHNLLLTIFAETGIAGACAMLWAWWRFTTVLRERVAGASPANAAIALAVAAGLAGTWVQGLIDTVTVVIFGLWLPAMALALAAAGARSKE